MLKTIKCHNCLEKFEFSEPKNYEFTDKMPDGVLHGGYWYCQDCCDDLEDDTKMLKNRKAKEIWKGMKKIKREPSTLKNLYELYEPKTSKQLLKFKKATSEINHAIHILKKTIKKYEKMGAGDSASLEMIIKEILKC